MSLSNYASSSFVVAVNGRRITEWGDTDPPFTDRTIDQRNTLRRGQGRRSAKLLHPTPGRQVVLNLAPGGADSAFLQSLYASGATVSLTATQIGTLDARVGAEGVVTDNGDSGRGGATTVTDDVYTLEFAVWTETRGGE